MDKILSKRIEEIRNSPTLSESGEDFVAVVDKVNEIVDWINKNFENRRLRGRQQQKSPR